MMVALSEIYQLDQHVAIDHDIVGLQIQVNYPVISNVTQGLDDGEDEVKLSREGNGRGSRVQVFF